ncbi:MAG: hypothetical protein PVF45_00675 [Anaerolineae bacterium]|jgi:hypothetical protein
MVDDPYLDVIDEQWENILMMYNLFAAKGPVMLYDVQDGKIYAYPYKEFRADLNQRSQAILKKQYRQARANAQMVLFIRDAAKRQFRSYSLNLDRKEQTHARR